MDKDLIKVIRPPECFGNSVSKISDLNDQSKNANLRKQRIYDIIFNDSEDINFNETSEDIFNDDFGDDNFNDTNILNDETASIEDTEVEILDIIKNNPDRPKPKNVVIPQGKKYNFRSKIFKNEPRNQKSYNFHLKSKMNVLICKECEKSFPKKSSLIHHLKNVHYKCAVCKNSFEEKFQLINHMNSLHQG